jgi:hypothetical protein
VCFSWVGGALALYSLDVVGVVFIALGYWRAITPMKSEAAPSQPGAAG